MPDTKPELNAVTGVFGYTGRFIAQRLVASGRRVRALTIHTGRPDPFGDSIESAHLNFDNPESLARALKGVGVFYNTYWVRFEYGGTGFAQAIANTRKLLRAAREARVRRFVQISVSNPAKDSPLPYYRGKAEVEQAVIESGLPYAIVRPTLVFGQGDILLNNIAWLLRRLPLFAVAGKGDYRVQPVSVFDVAELSIQAANSGENTIWDAAGPEILTFREMLELIRDAVGSRARLVHLSPELTMRAVKLLDIAVRDVMLTEDELRGLMDNLLISHQPPLCHGSFRHWLHENSGTLGELYAPELRRHFSDVHR